jgi:hypothetical protein
MKKLLLLGTVLVQVHLPAQPAPKPIPLAPELKDEGQIILLQGVPLETVLDLYSTLTGKTILAAQNLPKVIFDLKTLNPLTNDETIHFLESALEQRGISIIPQGDKILKVIPSAETVKNAMAPIEVKRGKLPDTLGYVVVKVKIKNVLPKQMIDILTPFSAKPNAVIALDDSVLLRDRTLNVKRMMKVIEDIDIKPVTFEEKIPVKNRTSGEICQLMNSLTSSLNSPWPASMAFLPLNEAKAVLVIAPFKSDLTRAKSIINKLDQSKNSNPTQP